MMPMIPRLMISLSCSLIVPPSLHHQSPLSLTTTTLLQTTPLISLF
ncbi:hypothetical protein Golob_009010, partial [Gossypium lobatum]|nr:hypothetical protein [Gossypium lobatum]